MNQMAHSSSGIDSGPMDKYKGILMPSPWKTYKKRMIQIFSYIFSVAPDFNALNSIIAFIRMLQFIGPSLSASIPRLYKTDSKDETCIQYVSILWHLVPPKYQEDASLYLMGIICGIFFIVDVLIAASLSYFKQNAKLPNFLAAVISILFKDICAIFPTICVTSIFAKMSYLIEYGDTTSQSNKVASIILIVLSVALLAFYLFILLYIASQSIIFRPMPLAPILNLPSNLLWGAALLINAVQSISIYLSRIVQIVCMVIVALIYLSCLYLPFLNGGFVKYFDNCFLLACSATGFVLSALSAIFLAVESTFSVTFLVAFVLLIVIFYIISHFILKNVSNSDIMFLEQCNDGKTLIETISTTNKFIRIGVNGMQSNHPITTSWTYFIEGTKKWPKEGTIWLLFAKMAAIYPEEIKTLQWINREIRNTKVKGFSARCIKEQTISLTRMREINLSSELKYSIGRLNKEVTSTKHKMRHVFDVMIQGNIHEIESSVKTLTKALEKNDADFKHLLRQYPNNRFVLRSYARFLSELMANHTETQKLLEQTRLLQRGITVSADEAHTLGLQAFPNLPDVLTTAKLDVISEASTSESIDLEADQSANDELENVSMKSQIERVKIPFVNFFITYHVLFMLILFIIPVIIFIFFTDNYIDNSIDIIHHMYNLAITRTIEFQITTFAHRYFFEKVGQFKPVIITGDLPTSLGSTESTPHQVEFLIGELTAVLQNVAQFKEFHKNSPYIEKAKSLIFDDVTTYRFYRNTNHSRQENVSIPTGLLDFALQLSDITTMPVDGTIVTLPAMLNPCDNVDNITNNLDSALENMVSYIEDFYNTSKSQCTIIMAVLIPIDILFVCAFLVKEILDVRRTKTETYRALISLPKNAVSTIADNLRVLKNEATDENQSTGTRTEMSKQEENILKIFNTGGTSSSSNYIDAAVLITTQLLVLLLHILCIYFLIKIITDCNQSNVSFAPHLNYLLGAYSGLLFMDYSVHSTGMSFLKYKHHIRTRQQRIDLFFERSRVATEFYKLSRFGGDSGYQHPFKGYDAALENAKKLMKCDQENLARVPHSILEAGRCQDADVVFLGVKELLEAEIVGFTDKEIPLNSLEDVYANTWSLLISPIYDKFFAPMAETIVPTIQSELDNFKDSTYTIVIVLTVIAVLITIISIYQIWQIRKHIISVLNLLLHFPLQTVLQTQQVMKVLGGNFSSNKNDQVNKAGEFYNEVLENLKDAVLISDQQTFLIEKANKACERILGELPENFVGKNVKDVFQQFEGYDERLITSNQQFRLTIKRNDGDEINVEATTININGKYATVTRDITSIVRYNNLITAERNRNDKLLSSILPPSLVKRVQAGEKTISFEVQSATIVFMDIVSFTPWCGALPAATVMTTLNNLFKKFDASAATFPTMTKIKCIGDCYMAAGGIFDTVNQPAVHSKEVVSFGLMAIGNVNELNKEIGENLKIRVGVNTGGPIVAGVLGVGKPTFEIIGPAINMAQQMEHNGVPMEVHISRSVYELIYGDSFVVKERGTIEVKGGSVQTYLVTSYNS